MGTNLHGENLAPDTCREPSFSSKKVRNIVDEGKERLSGQQSNLAVIMGVIPSGIAYLTYDGSAGLFGASTPPAAR
jgi:hypothetical protein